MRHVHGRHFVKKKKKKKKNNKMPIIILIYEIWNRRGKKCVTLEVKKKVRILKNETVSPHILAKGAMTYPKCHCRKPK